jgi:hypothetical protein
MTGTIECPACHREYKTERSLAIHVARFHDMTQPEKPIDDESNMTKKDE